MRFLFVGLGGIGQRHLRNLRAIVGDEAEVLAYRQRGLGRTLTDRLAVESETGLEEKYRVEVHRSLESALARRPDVAFVCNPSSMHVATALAAARAGCHLFIEKPLAHEIDGVDALIGTVEARGLVAMVGYQLRFHPCLRELRRLLTIGAVGRVVAVRAEVGEYLPGWHPYEDYRRMYASRRDLGGGVVLSQVHELDYLYWLFGLPRRVVAVGGHLSQLDIDVEDVASVLMEHVVEGRAFPVHLQQDYLQRPPSRTCHVLGDAGKIFMDLHALSVQWHDAEGRLAGTSSFAGFERNQLFLDELQHFLACVATGLRPEVTLRDGLASLQMALAAKHSLATGAPVVLAPPVGPAKT